jgi:putative metalloprotease
MVSLLPILLAVLAGLAMWWFSAWRLRKELDTRSTPLRDSRIGFEADRLARVLDLPALPVHVFETPAINGLAAPDGRIFITRGFLDRYRAGQVGAEEIAAVIAHELGHLALGHTRRRMIDFTGQNVLRIVLMMLFGRFLPIVGIWVANAVASLVMAGLSRRDEYEADAFAAALLTRAGIGTGPQKRLFAKLAALAPGGGVPAWLMSHPKSADRIRAIEDLEARWAGEG